MYRRLSSIAAAFILPIVCCACLCGCGGKTSLYAKALYSDNTVSIPVENFSRIGAQSYDSKLDLEKVLPYITQTNLFSAYKAYPDNVSVSGAGDYLFLEKDNGDGTLDYFCLQVTGKKSNKRFYYRFDSTYEEIAYAAENGVIEYFTVLFPFMYVSDRYYEGGLYVNLEYVTIASVDDFFDFYERSGWFDVKREDNAVVIDGFKQNVQDSLKLPFSFKLSFRENLGLTLFKIEKA